MDEGSTLLLFGYNREHTRDIPVPVTYLCLLYYFEYDKWNKLRISERIELKDDNVTIEHIGRRATRYNAFLTNKWSSGKCQWKFQVVNLKKFSNIERGGRVFIGIWKAKYTPPLSIPFSAWNTRCVGTSINLRNKANGEMLKVGDIIDMFVDFDELRMRFQINGTDFYSSEDHKEGIKIENSEYIVGVNLEWPGDSIKLLS